MHRKWFTTRALSAEGGTCIAAPKNQGKALSKAPLVIRRLGICLKSVRLALPLPLERERIKVRDYFFACSLNQNQRMADSTPHPALSSLPPSHNYGAAGEEERKLARVAALDCWRSHANRFVQARSWTNVPSFLGDFGGGEGRMGVNSKAQAPGNHQAPVTNRRPVRCSMFGVRCFPKS